MSQSAEPGLTPTVGERDHVRGPLNAAVTLVEYGDFECPDTVAAYPFVKAILRQHGDRVRFIFRHYPLIKIHPRAKPAAEATEAAAEQGKFWVLHDRLFEHPYQLQRHQLIAHARELRFDLERFERELGNPRHASRVLSDLESGARSGVPGTPTFYINGRRFEGPEDWKVLTEAVVAAVSG